mgnify:CR=1 FL=1
MTSKQSRVASTWGQKSSKGTRKTGAHLSGGRIKDVTLHSIEQTESSLEAVKSWVSCQVFRYSKLQYQTLTPGAEYFNNILRFSLL